MHEFLVMNSYRKHQPALKGFLYAQAESFDVNFLHHLCNRPLLHSLSKRLFIRMFLPTGYILSLLPSWNR